MRKLILFILLNVPVVVNAQALKHSRAYLGGVLQEGRFGGSLILSYGVNPYLGIGAGVDLLSYRRINREDASFFAPFYVDLRLKYPVRGIEPFVYGQFGKQSYESKLASFIDITGAPTYELREQGKYFYGIGMGIGSTPNRPKFGVFASATYRFYQFQFSPSKLDINGRILDDRSQEMLVISAGLVF
jgi:hypothetical protein